MSDGGNMKLLGVSVASLLVGTSHAVAQDNTAGSDTQVSTAGGYSEALDEIVVTATKRAERLQDVPSSIAVVTAGDIDRRLLVSASDYLRGIPGVNQTNQTVDGASIVIRGVETSPSAQNFSSGATVATYFGETPTTNSGGLGGGTNVDIKLVDIERVEVLRGPQGTAFGNSSLGGAVRVIPVAPNLAGFEGKIGAGYSATGDEGGINHTINGVANFALVPERLAVRVVGYQFVNSGFYTNRAGSDEDFIAAAADPYNAESLARDAEGVGDSKFVGGRLSALYRVNDALDLTFGYLTQRTEMDGHGVSNSAGGAYEQTMLQIGAPEHIVRGRTDGISDTSIDIFNVMGEYDLGWGDLVATWSYLDSGSIWTQPVTRSLTLEPRSQGGDSEHNEYSGEIRLTTKFDGAVNVLAGLYAEELDDEGLWTYSWDGDAATNPYAPGAQYLGEYLDRRKLTQQAAFAELSWDFMDAFTLTGGVRGYKYERNVRTNTAGPFFGVTATDDAADASGANYRANLSYKPHDNVLFYSGWSQGFRLGKPQPGLPAALCDVDADGIIDGTTNVTLASTKSLDSDSVDSYEIGAKFSLLDRRITADVGLFRVNWTDLPVRVGAPPQPLGCNLAYNANAGNAVSEGVELQVNLRLTDALSVDMGGSWLDARLDDDAPAIGASAGDRLPGSPEVNVNFSMQYGFEAFGHAAHIRADAIYVGPFYGDILSSPQTATGDYVKIDTVARMTFDTVYVDFYVRNVTNEDAFSFRGTSAGRGDYFGHRLRPRTLGVRVGYDF